MKGRAAGRVCFSGGASFGLTTGAISEVVDRLEKKSMERYGPIAEKSYELISGTPTTNRESNASA